MKRPFIATACLTACTTAAPVSSERAASQLCVVRHAQAFKNLDPRPAGMRPDRLDALTPEGAAQAWALQRRLPTGVAGVWSSPTRRTRQTAEILARSAPVRIESALRSLDGDRSWSARTAAWSRGEDPRPEGGESLGDGAARARSLLDRVQAELAPGRSAVLVTHGDIASVLLGELRGTPLLERPRRHRVGTGEMVCMPRPAARSDAGQPKRTSTTPRR